MFCRVCGNEVNEQAIICPKCGCSIENVFVNKNVKERKETSKTSTAFKVFNYITAGLICLAITFLVLSIINCDLYFWSSYSYGRLIINYEYATISLIVSLIALGSSISAFVISFNEENKEKRFSSDVLFIISIFVVFVSFFTLL